MASGARSTSKVAEVMAPRKMTMRLHLLKGTFVTDDARGACVAMHPAVWSRMPEDLIWRVLLLVPAVKLFQLQLVSRQWRQVLTSASFRKQFVATAAAAARSRRGAEAGAAKQQCVIGCIMCGVSVVSGGNGGGGSKKVKVLDIDLSFVPAWFWKSDCYSVETAADGLVCIRNDKLRQGFWEPTDYFYGVINPLTRTFKLLPEVPFFPWRWLGSTAPVAVTDVEKNDDGNYDWTVATCDLEGAGQGQWTLVDAFHRQGPRMVDSQFAVCDGEVFMFGDRRMHVVRCSAAAEAVVTFDVPESLHRNWLGTPLSSFPWSEKCVKLVTHRGSVFFVADLEQAHGRPCPAMVCGVWRLVRSCLMWEAVAELELEGMHRLTESRYSGCQRPDLFRVRGAGDLLCFMLRVYCRQDLDDWSHIVLGLNLETGTWELLYDQLRGGFESILKRGCENLVELRPDSFLL